MVTELCLCCFLLRVSLILLYLLTDLIVLLVLADVVSQDLLREIGELLLHGVWSVTLSGMRCVHVGHQLEVKSETLSLLLSQSWD